MGFKLYSPVEGHTVKYGVEFVNGVGLTSSATTAALLEARGYTKVEADGLSEFDNLPTTTLVAFATELGVTLEEDATKAEIVAALLSDRATLVEASENFADVVAGIRTVLDDVAIVTQEALNTAVGAVIEPFEEGGGA